MTPAPLTLAEIERLEELDRLLAAEPPWRVLFESIGRQWTDSVSIADANNCDVAHLTRGYEAERDDPEESGPSLNIAELIVGLVNNAPQLLSLARAALTSSSERDAVIEWRKDCWGVERQALYLGGLYVGHIMTPPKGRPKWRGWFMNDDEGNETGWFDTSDEARVSVEEALRRALKSTELKEVMPDTDSLPRERLDKTSGEARGIRGRDAVLAAELPQPAERSQMTAVKLTPVPDDDS